MDGGSALKSSRPGPDAVSLFSDVDARVTSNAPIGRELTWYRIGGSADLLVEPNSVEALATVVKRCRDSRVPVRVLGSGANLLVDDDGVDGVVLRLSHEVFASHSWVHRHRAGRGGPGELNRQGDFPSGGADALRVMAGEKLERLVQLTAKQGMAGLEKMAGIPASIGGAVRMNAGGRYGSIGDAISAVGTLDLNGNLQTYPAADLRFEYRRSSLIDPVILWAEFRLEPDDPDKVRARVREIFQFKTASQPMSDRSCGCVFKNPPHLAFDSKSGLAPDALGRVSAGALIDRAGLKGVRSGGAEISPLHANFITVEPQARARDVIALLERAQSSVRDHFGYDLHPELVIWRRQSMEGEKTP